MKQRNIFLAALLILVTVFFAGCAEEQATPQPAETIETETAASAEPAPIAITSAEPDQDDDSEVLATYGDKKFTLNMARYLQPGDTPPDETLVKMVDWWLEVQMAAEEALERELTDSAKAKFHVAISKKVAYRRLLLENEKDSIEITEQDVKDYYEENKANDRMINEPTQLSFTHITTDSLEKAQEALEKINQGQNINELVKEYSVNSDARRGGVVTKMAEETVLRRFGKPLVDALLDASEGDVVGPVKAMKEGQFEIAQHQGKRLARRKSYEEAKDRIKEFLERNAQRESGPNLSKALKEKYKGKFTKSKRILDAEAEVEKNAAEGRPPRPRPGRPPMPPTRR